MGNTRKVGGPLIIGKPQMRLHAKEMALEEKFSQLTSRRKPPNAKQKTNGPARSVSSKMLFSVVRKGLRTESV